jgi:hypothetical protein
VDVWPALPLVIRGNISNYSKSADNIAVALGHRDRVCKIYLRVTRGLEWDKILAAMEVPFPALTGLWLECEDEQAPVIPDTFLGGSAPRLGFLALNAVPFPGIPTLLLSTTYLVQLLLYDIPHSGYISPEAMVSCLSVLTTLDTLYLDFLSFQQRSDREGRRPPPMTRSILPNLTRFWFKGVSEYLEDLVVGIDAPRLQQFFITFLHQINFDTPHLVQFINRTPKLEKPNVAMVGFDFDAAEVRLRVLPCKYNDYGEFCVKILCEESDQQPSSIAQVCAMCLPPLHAVKNLRVYQGYTLSESIWKGVVENNQWLELLHSFTGVESLYLSTEFQPSIASALQELVGGRTTEVLPSLQNIFLAEFKPSGSFQENIEQFAAARQLSGHPIAISVWDKVEDPHIQSL